MTSDIPLDNEMVHQVLAAIKEHGFISTLALVDLFDVSRTHIRRCCIALEENGNIECEMRPNGRARQAWWRFVHESLPEVVSAERKRAIRAPTEDEVGKPWFKGGRHPMENWL